MITVIIAHKDYNQYLQQAIDSCILQTTKVNYVVVDDGSTIPPEPPDWPVTRDSDYKVYEQDGNKFIYLKESLGPSMARNVGIIESWEYTDYFQILDADDIMHVNKCSDLLSAFDSNTGVVYADYYIESNGIRKIEFKRPYSKAELEHHCIVHSGSMISKQVLSMVIEGQYFYDPQLRCAEDYDLFLRCSEKMMIKHVPKVLTTVKEHSLNSTHSVSSDIWQFCLQRVHQKRMMRANA